MYVCKSVYVSVQRHIYNTTLDYMEYVTLYPAEFIYLYFSKKLRTVL